MTFGKVLWKKQKKVHEWLSQRGIEHITKTLQWKEIPSVGHMQQVAREYRYSTLETICLQRGIKFLLTGHHADDQIETWFLRFACESGVDGLACMSPKRKLSEYVTLIRPFLEYS